MRELYFVVFCGLLASVFGQGSYTHSKSINANYKLSWKLLNKTHIGFQTEVQASGWFGFGLSADGKMFPGDVVLGYVDHNTALFNDYHTTGYLPPTLDNSQDWFLVSGANTNRKLVFEFVRALNTHDFNDVIISHGDTHIIWAFSNDRPMTETDFSYHRNNRGSVVINLFSNSDLVGK